MRIQAVDSFNKLSVTDTLNNKKEEQDDKTVTKRYLEPRTGEWFYYKEPLKHDTFTHTQKKHLEKKKRKLNDDILEYWDIMKRF